MRACLSFILSVILLLNAAYGPSVSVWDTFEDTSGHAAAHFGHHSHEGGDNNGKLVDADGTGKATMSDHHIHVYPSFPCLLSDTIGVTSSANCTFLIESTASTFVSAPQARLDRPPRTVLA